MLQLFLILHIFIGATLCGVAVVIALTLGFTTLTPILIALAAGFLAAFPVSWVVAKRITSSAAPKHPPT